MVAGTCHRLGQSRGRVHQLADGGADEILAQRPEVEVELGWNDSVRPFEEPLWRMAVVIVDDQRVSLRHA
jgi:hypothetical protein